jgi:hypothetical protein
MMKIKRQTFKDVECKDDGGCGYTNHSEVENDSSDSSIKLSTKHINKSKKKFRVAVV